MAEVARHTDAEAAAEVAFELVKKSILFPILTITFSFIPFVIPIFLRTFALDSSQSLGTRRVAKDIVGQRPSSPSQGWSRKGRFQNVIFCTQISQI